MDTNSSQATAPKTIKSDSHLSDVERSFLASASWPKGVWPPQYAEITYYIVSTST